MSENIKKLNGELFGTQIEKGITLIDFYADWCGPCKQLAPFLEQVSMDKEIQEKVTIGKLDIDNAQDVASKYQVTSVPTMILFKDGKEIGRLVGLRDFDTIKKFIKSEGEK